VEITSLFPNSTIGHSGAGIRFSRPPRFLVKYFEVLEDGAYLRRLENGTYTYQYVNIISNEKRYFWLDASLPHIGTIYKPDFWLERHKNRGLEVFYLVQKNPKEGVQSRLRGLLCYYHRRSV